ncbi:MAG: hypothetical protein CENE_00734 [Candidatus Celerinatantimonas neptuna]|nr:MAG: hypothetical protein CENE_00734 [Candidatus Celerinatantimonas neptuna]
MKINIPTTNGFINDKYSKYAPDSLKYNGNPKCSFPISIIDPPERTKSFAVVLIDHDSIPVCGFSWIHWICCNIDSSIKEIPEGFGSNIQHNCVHGKNSFASPFLGDEDTQLSQCYIGPTPPDKDHQYELTIYALDKKLDLEQGFFYNQFLDNAKGHILDITKSIFISRV